MRRLKGSARERTKEEMNNFAKKAKIQVSARRKTNIRDLKKKKKKRKPKSEINQNRERKLNRR